MPIFLLNIPEQEKKTRVSNPIPKLLITPPHLSSIIRALDRRYIYTFKLNAALYRW